jgi:hypothetical protein
MQLILKGNELNSNLRFGENNRLTSFAFCPFSTFLSAQGSHCLSSDLDFITELILNGSVEVVDNLSKSKS